jgi:hypothetical protein
MRLGFYTISRLALLSILVMLCSPRMTPCRALKSLKKPVSPAQQTAPQPRQETPTKQTATDEAPRPDPGYAVYRDNKCKLSMDVPQGWVYEVTDSTDSPDQVTYLVEFTPGDTASRYHAISGSDYLRFQLIKIQENVAMNDFIKDVIASFERDKFTLSNTGTGSIEKLQATSLTFAGKREDGSHVTVNCLIAKIKGVIISLQGRATPQTAVINKEFVRKMGETMYAF